MLLIGIDVGGTNTDGILLNPSKLKDEDKGVIKFHKTGTTADVSKGIETAVESLFEGITEYSKKDVLSVTIGTTHFINAVIERDRARLEKVAVFRICGPYSHTLPPFSNFPDGLTEILECYNAYIEGGYRVDGIEIRELDEDSILEHAMKVKQLGINCVAINGIYSAVNKSHEIRTAELVRSVIPDAKIVMSHEVSGVGFLARENASILNAAILTFASKILKSFAKSIKNLKFDCPILLTQNDGTVLTIDEAMKTPIKTFSSGATNSMRGAAFLCSDDPDAVGKNVMVVDVGGTTSDVGLLQTNGFPRQVSSHSVVGGVMMNFSMPHVESIGLGGGSIIREEQDGSVTIGPDSVGAEVMKQAIIFGGEVVTTTDVTVAVNGDNNSKFPTANISSVEGKFSDSFVEKYNQTLSKKLSAVIDRMRTSPEPLPVLLVGGGSFISPLEIEGASKVIRPPYYQVANALGAALGKLSFVLQKMKKLDHLSEKDLVIEQMIKEATNELVEKGGLASTVTVVDIFYDAMPYIDKSFTFEVKVVADVDYSRLNEIYKKFSSEQDFDEDLGLSVIKDSNIKNSKSNKEATAIDYKSYKPFINEKREWILSEIDIEFLRIGVYVMGCGGGGTSYPPYLELKNMIKNGDIIRVIDIKDAPKDGGFIPVASAGSPTVTLEQLVSNEIVDACEIAFDYYKRRADGMISTEIGGGNGLRGLVCGSSSKLNLPTIDCDLMGRAYPTLSQIKPCIFHDELFLNLSAVSDGNGNKFLVTGAQSDIYVEKMVRAALAELGSHVGVAHNLLSHHDLEAYSVHNSLSNAWRIGKAVKISQQTFQIDKLAENIIDSLGGPKVGRKVFYGKIIAVEKKLFKGHVYGEVIIENKEKDLLSIPFKNENLVAKLKKEGSEDWEVVCSVPDLISVCYADSGEAVGTPEYRYGIMVFVLAFAPDPSWMTANGLKVGGPTSFGPGFSDIPYKPVGESVLPKSIIEEYSSK